MNEIKLEEMAFLKTAMYAGIECETPGLQHKVQGRLQRANHVVICVEQELSPFGIVEVFSNGSGRSTGFKTGEWKDFDLCEDRIWLISSVSQSLMLQNQAGKLLAELN